MGNIVPLPPWTLNEKMRIDLKTNKLYVYLLLPTYIL